MFRYLSILLILVCMSCASQPSTQSPSTGGGGGNVAPSRNPIGGSSPREAVQRFLAAVKAEDIQATALVWGTKDGPARDSDIPRKEQEMRIIIMQCYLAHDSATIINDSPGDNGRRVLQVELINNGIRKSTPFTTVKGGDDRWFVETVDLNPVKEFCRNPPQG